MLCDGKREEYYSYCCTHISGRHLADCLYDTILQQYSTFFCRSPSSSTFSFFFFFVFRLFPVPPFLSCFRFLALIGGGFCSLGTVLHPPARCCEPANLRIPSCVSFFLAFLLLCFASVPFLFRFRFGSRFVSSCLFVVGIMLSPRFLLRLVQRIFIHMCMTRTYADLPCFI